MPCRSRRASIGSRPRATRCLSRRPSGASGGDGRGVSRGVTGWLRVCDGAGVLAAGGVVEGVSVVFAAGFDGFNGLIARVNPAHNASSSSLNWRRRLMALLAVFASAQPPRRQRILAPAPRLVSVPAAAHPPPWDLPWWWRSD